MKNTDTRITFIVGYLAFYLIWKQFVFGPYSYVLYRLLYLAFVALLLFTQGELKKPSFSLGGRYLVAGVALAFLLRIVASWIAHEGSIVLSTKHFADNVVLAPINEEIVFRGVLLESLMQVTDSNGVAIILSAGIFASVHNLDSPIRLIPLFILGLLLGHLYRQTKSVICCIAAHSSWNLASFLV